VKRRHKHGGKGKHLRGEGKFEKMFSGEEEQRV